MLIDAQYPDEIRVAVVSDNQIVDFDIESQEKRLLRGNIYLAKVSGVEPSLQAAFVDYGGNRHGFLAFDEIHPDYFQIPQEDREALLVEQAKLAADGVDLREPAEDGDVPEEESANAKEADVSDDPDDGDSSGEDNGDTQRNNASESEAEEAREADKRLRKLLSRRYRIQEVIKKRQVILVQVVKDERGNKGAALTTYMSLAGRYCVLMPNTSRGGGVSRKIARQPDRARLKKIIDQLDLPSGMGLIVRTAGARRTKADIERDHSYLNRLWSGIRQTVLTSTAPCLVHEEASLVLRSVRDLYDPEISAIHVQGEATRREVERNIDLLIPEDRDKVISHDSPVPLFSSFGLEAQIENIFQPKVELASGGYLVIDQTEALVTVDVNSGRSTRERSIETTALRTNLEAAEAAARQMRLRDLAGLIVIDFIDMESKRNIRAVEKAMKKALEVDRARVQHGNISAFGLMELSRQRRRAGIASLTSVSCPACAGIGSVRAPQSMALRVIRAMWARAATGKRGDIIVRVGQDTALYLLNAAREQLSALEQHSGCAVRVEIDTSLAADQMVIGRLIAGRFRGLPDRVTPPAKTEQTARRRGRKVGDSHSNAHGNSGDARGESGTGAETASPAAIRRRVPEIAIDGGEMLDAIASVPFVLADAWDGAETPPVTGTEVDKTSAPTEADQSSMPDIQEAMVSASEPKKPRTGWWSKRSAS